MNRSCIFIIFFILVIFHTNLSFAGDVIKTYDMQGDLTSYTVIEDSRETHYDSSWGRVGHTLLKENKETHYNVNQSRIGKTVWNNNNTGTTYDESGNRTGHLRKEGDRIIFFDKGWNRQGYKR